MGARLAEAVAKKNTIFSLKLYYTDFIDERNATEWGEVFAEMTSLK